MTQPATNQPIPPEIPDHLLPPQTTSSGNKAKVVIGLGILVLLIVVVSFLSFNIKPKTSVKNAAASTQPANIAPATVSITSTNFVPVTVYIKVGQAVVWTNTDKTNHSIASDNPHPIFSSQSLSPNDSFSYVFNKAGTYPYHDNANTRLAGIVVVK